MDGVHKLSSRIQGVLGQEFLSRFDYLIDFGARRIRFKPPEPGGYRRGFRLVDGRPAIETDRGRMVLDSGTEVALLYVASPGPGGEAPGRVATASGMAPATEIRELRFRVSGREFSATTVMVPRGSLKEDGVLPANLLRSVYANNSGQYLILKPEAGPDR